SVCGKNGRSALVVRIWERISAGESLPWIIKVDRLLNHCQAERLHGGRIRMHILPDKIVSDSRAKPDRRFPVSGWIPRQRHTRIQVSPLRGYSGLAGESRVSGITETRRGRRNNRALLACIK